MSQSVDIFVCGGEDSGLVLNRLRLAGIEALGQAAECLRTLAHPHRLRIVQMLLQGWCAVEELAESCDLLGSMMSEYLRLKWRCGFLVSDRIGRQVFYRVAEPQLGEILECVEDRFATS